MSKLFIFYILQLIFSIFLFYISSIISKYSAGIGVIFSALSIIYFVSMLFRIIGEITEED